MLRLGTLDPKFVTDSHGEKTAVILPIGQFDELVALLEDLEDIAAIEKEGDQPTRSHEDFVKALKASGYLPG
jgi:hypothetical protein